MRIILCKVRNRRIATVSWDIMLVKEAQLVAKRLRLHVHYLIGTQVYLDAKFRTEGTMSRWYSKSNFLFLPGRTCTSWWKEANNKS